MSKFLFYFLFFSLNCKAPLNHWEMALNKFIIIIIIINPKFVLAIGSRTSTFYNTFYTTMRNNELAYDGDQIRLRRRVHQ